MSIISCTSPWPSARIFPISRLTRSPSGSFSSRSALPRSRTRAPRRGAGSIRNDSNAGRRRGEHLLVGLVGRLDDARDRLPVVGLCETSSCPSGSVIQPSGPGAGAWIDVLDVQTIEQREER